MVGKIFYALVFEESEISNYLNAIRSIADPTAKYGTHITISGPHDKSLSATELRQINDDLSDVDVEVDGIGTFDDESQSTVFFQCKAVGLERHWYKPSYPNEFTPHLTLYDGASAVTGYLLTRLLGRYDWHFHLKSSSVVELKRESAPALNLVDIQHDDLLARNRWKPANGMRSKAASPLVEQMITLERLIDLLAEETSDRSESSRGHAGQHHVEGLSQNATKRLLVGH